MLSPASGADWARVVTPVASASVRPAEWHSPTRPGAAAHPDRLGPKCAVCDSLAVGVVHGFGDLADNAQGGLEVGAGVVQPQVEALELGMRIDQADPEVGIVHFEWGEQAIVGEGAHCRVFMLAELVRLSAFPLRRTRRDRTEPDPGSVRWNERVFSVPILELLIEGIEGAFE